MIPGLKKMPDRAGVWIWKGSHTRYRRVLVTENPASGRMCRELGMGGSAQCGLRPWSGVWIHREAWKRA